MVKLEECDGDTLIVSPSHVVSIRVAGAGTSIVETVRATEEVKGTPDEVHAKLFPEERAMGFTLLERNQAMLRVLEWVAGTVIGAPLWVQEDARKALGREGA